MAYEVEGMDEFFRDMESLPYVIQRRVLARALRAAGKPIQERQRQTAPDDPTTPGSQIRENIGLNVSDQAATGATAYIGPTKAGFIGGFAEHGTFRQRKTPFIDPSFEEAQAVGIIAEILGSSIERELKKRSL